MSAYVGRFAHHYDTFYSEKDYATESRFVKHVLGSLSPFPVRRILELACGTGSHALCLDQSGYEMLATDYSEDMLAVAAAKAQKASSRVSFRQLDMRCIDRQLGEFDAVIALFDSIGYARDNDSITAVLSGVRQVLRRGGLFLFEFWHASAMLCRFDPVRVRRWSTTEGELIRISETTVASREQLATVRYEVIELRRDGTFERLRETHVNRFFSVPEMHLMLIAAGLTPRKFYAGFTDSQEINESVWHVVAVAQSS